MFSFTYARRHGVLLSADRQTLYCRADTALEVLTEARRVVADGLQARAPQLSVLSAAQFAASLAVHYRDGEHDAMTVAEGLGEQLGDDFNLSTLAEHVPRIEDLLEQEGDAPMIRLINAILSAAVKAGASDIHFETFEQSLCVRLRVDGMLREILRPRRALANLLVSRIKVMARLDIAEKRVPQDGRIALRIAGLEIDVRVSVLPSSHGERVVLRLLDKQAGRLDLAQLGMPPATRARLQLALHKPHGIVLVTGPTGSGKTTTLYAGLVSLNVPSRNILTVEDPVEYNIEGIGQTQVNPKVDMSFARSLRAILRQDPDVVMIGEIRDRETAEIAVQASLTGHLVLSTLHTNSAVGAVTRLIDMGIEPFLLASSLCAVMAQRLVRVLCKDCKQAVTADAAMCALLGLSAASAAAPVIYQAQGCAICQQIGYRGRVGVYELVLFDDAMRQLIHQGGAEAALNILARQRSPSLLQAGRDLVLQGATSLDELMLVAVQD